MNTDKTNKNYFQLFNLKESFDLDEKALEENYIILQSTCHPDLFFTEKEKNLAFDKSQEINHAYSILKSHISRAEYLLQAIYNIPNFIPNNKVLTEFFTLQEHVSNFGNNEQLITNLIEKHLLELYKSFENMNIFLAQKSILFLKYLLKLK